MRRLPIRRWARFVALGGATNIRVIAIEVVAVLIYDVCAWNSQALTLGDFAPRQSASPHDWPIVIEATGVIIAFKRHTFDPGILFQIDLTGIVF
jgi:hypothetical protein